MHYLKILYTAQMRIFAGRVKPVFQAQLVNLLAPIQMRDIFLHVTFEPSISSLSDMVDFWFVKKTDIGTIMRHLQAILVRPSERDGIITIRHNSFCDFFLRPHKPHDFSFSSVDTSTKYFFFLRRLIVKQGYRNSTPRTLSSSQWLGYMFFCCNNRQVCAVLISGDILR